jgi:HD-like signal output (HDOD) protein
MCEGERMSSDIEKIISCLANLSHNWAVLRNTRSFAEEEPAGYWKEFDKCMGDAFNLQLELMRKYYS